MDLGLSDKTAVVLAASKGIGHGIARSLLEEGCDVVITSSNQTNLEEAGSELEKIDGGRVHIVRMDLFSPDEVQRVGEHIARDYTPDILITNGPGPPPCTALDIDHGALEKVLIGTVQSPIRLCQAVVPAMMQRRFGRVIMLASSTAKEPDEGMILSNLSRAAVVAFAKTLSREVASFGITVNSILTGSVLSERSENLMRAEAAELNVDYEKYLDEAAATIPVGRISTPDEFATAVVFLASPRASYVNGVSLAIDGGYMRSL